jgi:redox-sensitive bicupin YhaK (pirin superfamily)
MPAVTADTLTLARISTPGAEVTNRPVRSVTTAPSGFEGEGFPVRRAFAGIAKNILDPFIMMDQMGEVNYSPYEPRGTDWHPHRGFETVTYIMDGTFIHQDSHGGGGVISNGATQWMTAGGGILHIETPPESLVVSGGLFHGLQLWVNLPAKQKMISPAYQNLEADMVKLLTTPDATTLIRLIAGDIDGVQGPGSSKSWHMRLFRLVHAWSCLGTHSSMHLRMGSKVPALLDQSECPLVLVKQSCSDKATR